MKPMNHTAEYMKLIAQQAYIARIEKCSSAYLTIPLRTLQEVRADRARGK